MSLRWKRIWILILDAMIVLCLSFSSLLLHISEMISPFCPLRTVTGLLCPTCGGTHAIRYILRGDMASAIYSNAFVLLLAIYLFMLLLLANGACFLGNKKVMLWINKLLFPLTNYRIWIVLLAVALLFTIIRNLGLQLI